MQESSLTAATRHRGRLPADARASSRRLTGLVALGAALALVLALGFLRPLSIWRHPNVVSDERPLATVLGTDGAGALAFAVPVLLAFALYGAAARLARGLSGRAATAVVLAGTVLFSLILLPLNPVGAQDIYHNIQDARTLWVYGDNPMQFPPNAYADDPFFRHVPAWHDFPAPYGPVWYGVAGLPLAVTGSGLWPSVLGQKALTALALTALTALTLATAARLRPGAAPAAGVLVGWNPLLLFETAGNAHNDVVMVLGALAALYAVSRRWWGAVFPLLALAVATKYVLVVLGPVLLMWLWRRRDVPRRRLLLSLALGALVGVLVYLPFLAGSDLWTVIRRQTSFNTSSPSALLDALLWTRLHLTPEESSRIMKLIVVPLYLLAYGLVLGRIPRDPGMVALVRACFWSVFLLLAIATWWFWPWYLLWLVPLGALLPGTRLALIAAVFSATAMLMYVPYFWLLFGDGVVLQAATAGTAFVLPVLVALAPRRLSEQVGALAAD